MAKAGVSYHVGRESKRDREPPHFPHPTDSPKPGQPPARHQPWINPDPRS